MFSPRSFATVSIIFFANGQAKPIGVPLVMQVVKQIVSAPRFTISLARRTAFLPGQPPQLIKPTIFISSSTPVKEPSF